MMEWNSAPSSSSTQASGVASECQSWRTLTRGAAEPTARATPRENKRKIELPGSARGRTTLPLQCELSLGVHHALLCHALSSEREEVMGLLLGETLERGGGASGSASPSGGDGAYGVVRVLALLPQKRVDIRPDRVEATPEQLAFASSEAETIATQAAMEDRLRVVGWYVVVYVEWLINLDDNNKNGILPLDFIVMLNDSLLHICILPNI